MRKVEVERLAVLRGKVNSGQALSEKESERLQQLEELERKDSNVQNRSADSNVSRPGSGSGADNSSGSTNDHPGGGNTGGGKEGRSNSASSKQGERTERAFDSPGIGREGGGASSQTGVAPSTGGGEAQQRGDTFGEYRGETGNASGSADSAATGKTVVHAATNSGLKAPKSAKVNRNQKQTGKETTPEDIYSAILMSGFSLVANVTGRRHWEIEKEEADSVSVPLSKMLDSMSSANKKKLEKAMNPIMLGSAVAGIVIPRLMVDMSLMKGARNNGQRTAGNTQPTESVGTDHIQSNLKIGAAEPGGVSNTDTKADTPNVAPELAKLINGSDQ